MSKSRVRLYNGDCRLVMPKLRDETVDAIVADPPYGIDYRSTRGERIRNDSKPFIWWIDGAYRLLKDGSPIICFYRWDVGEPFRIALECGGGRVRSQVVWNKILHGQGDTKSTFAPSHELAWFATKGKYRFPGKRPKSVLSIQRVGRDRHHPNQKPVSLFETILPAIVPQGGCVLDPFMGVGSAGVACMRSGYRYIGIEYEREHFEIAKGRIHKERVPCDSHCTP